MIFSGSVGISDDTGECFPHLAQIRRLHLQKILGRPGVVPRAGDRLRDFVGKRGGQFSHHAYTVHMGEIRLHLLQPRQRLCAILDVRVGAVPRDYRSCVVAQRFGANEESAIRSVRAAHAASCQRRGSLGSMQDQAAARERRSHSSRLIRPRRASPNGTSERSSTRPAKYPASGSPATSRRSPTAFR